MADNVVPFPSTARQPRRRLSVFAVMVGYVRRGRIAEYWPPARQL